MSEIQKFDHIGGHLLIDLVNTEVMRAGVRADQLQSNADVVDWLLDVGLVTEEAIQFSWQDEATLLEQVRAFRQEMRQMVAGIVADQPIAEATIELINNQLRYWQAQPRVTRQGDGFEHLLEVICTRPEHLLAQLAEIAADFLATANFSYVKPCGIMNVSATFWTPAKTILAAGVQWKGVATE